jgi:hypothetical protein
MEQQPGPDAEPTPEWKRRDVLANALDIELLPGSGWRVESQDDFRAALVRDHRPNRILHLLLSIVTAGLWLVYVWLPIEVFKIGFEKRKVIWVDGAGNLRTGGRR